MPLPRFGASHRGVLPTRRRCMPPSSGLLWPGTAQAWRGHLSLVGRSALWFRASRASTSTRGRQRQPRRSTAGPSPGTIAGARQRRRSRGQGAQDQVPAMPSLGSRRRTGTRVCVGGRSSGPFARRPPCHPLASLCAIC